MAPHHLPVANVVEVLKICLAGYGLEKIVFGLNNDKNVQD